MNKQEFLMRLREGLSGLPQNEIEERLTFYSEMIDDRIEEGLSEEQAVGEIGDIDEIISQIVADIPLAVLVKEKVKPSRKLRVWEIVLLTLGSPIWLSLGIAVFSVIIAVYAAIWSVIVSLWAIETALICAALGSIFMCIFFIFNGHISSAIAMISAGMVCAGMSAFFFFGCKAVTKGVLLMTKKLVLSIKNSFVKERA